MSSTGRPAVWAAEGFATDPGTGFARLIDAVRGTRQAAAQPPGSRVARRPSTGVDRCLHSWPPRSSSSPSSSVSPRRRPRWSSARRVSCSPGLFSSPCTWPAWGPAGPPDGAPPGEAPPGEAPPGEAEADAEQSDAFHPRADGSERGAAVDYPPAGPSCARVRRSPPAAGGSPCAAQERWGGGLAPARLATGARGPRWSAVGPRPAGVTSLTAMFTSTTSRPVIPSTAPSATVVRPPVSGGC